MFSLLRDASLCSTTSYLLLALALIIHKYCQTDLRTATMLQECRTVAEFTIEESRDLGTYSRMKTIISNRSMLQLLLLACLAAPTQLLSQTSHLQQFARLECKDERSCPVRDISFAPNSTMLAVAGNKQVTFFDAASGEDRGSIKALDARSDVVSVDHSPDEKFVAAAQYRQIHVYNAHTKQRVWAARGGMEVAYSPDGKFLVTGNNRDKCFVYDTASRKLHSELDLFAGAGPIDTGLYKGQVRAVSFSTNSQLIAVHTEFFDEELPLLNRVQVWDVTTGKLQAFFPGMNCTFSPTENKLAYLGRYLGTTTRAWILRTDRYRWVGGLATGAEQIIYSADARTIASRDANGTVELWQFKSGAWREHKNIRTGKKLTCFAFSPNGKTLLSGTEDGVVLAWKWADRETHESQKNGEGNR